MLLDSCIPQLSSDVLSSTGSLVDAPSYHKQLDGPFDAPETAGRAALINIVMLQIYNIYCWNAASHSFPVIYYSQ